MEPETPPNSLYHYTDVHGLYGILTTLTLRATDINYMNDSSEGSFGIGQIKQVVDRELRELDTEDYWRLAEEIEFLSQWVETGPFALSKSQNFAACLSTQGDQLSQWRGYADNGFCIELDSAKLRQTLRDYTRGGQLAKVTYAPANQHSNEVDDQRLRRDVSRVFDNYLEDVEVIHHELKHGSLISDDFDDAVLEAQIEAHSRLIDLGLTRKNDAFSEENEWRIISSNETPEFRTSHAYGIVPYFPIKLHADTIRSIRIGPNKHAELQARGLRAFIRAQNRDWEVSKSSIPFRSP